jgi:hypothetical protein
MIAASDIVKKLRNGQNMPDLMKKTNLVMMAEPEKFAGTEKGRNPVYGDEFIMKRADADQQSSQSMATKPRQRLSGRIQVFKPGRVGFHVIDGNAEPASDA